MSVAVLLLLAAAGLHWTEDDYAKGLQEARERQAPLFVEVWAPW